MRLESHPDTILPLDSWEMGVGVCFIQHTTVVRSLLQSSDLSTFGKIMVILGILIVDIVSRKQNSPTDTECYS